MSCRLEYEQTYREQRRMDFISVYGKEPSDKELDTFIKYIEWTKRGRSPLNSGVAMVANP